MAAIAAVAQDTRPFESLFVDGKSWKILYSNFMKPERDGYITYTISGDSIVNGQKCKRLAVQYENNNNPWGNHCIAVYEEEGKSFILLYDEIWSPLFDFTVKAGDIIEQKDEWSVFKSWTVSSIEEIEVRNHKRSKIILEHPSPLPSYPPERTCWIEGIGSIDLFDMMTPFPLATDGSYYFFVECSLNGEVLLTCEDMGFAEVDVVRSDSTQKDGVVYDIHGRRVEQPQCGHIYIRDGKKFVQQ